MTYLVDNAALDAARIIGCRWEWRQVESRGRRRPFVDLMALSWWERFRLAWAMIGAHHVMDTEDTWNS